MFEGSVCFAPGYTGTQRALYISSRSTLMNVGANHCTLAAPNYKHGAMLPEQQTLQDIQRTAVRNDMAALRSQSIEPTPQCTLDWWSKRLPLKPLVIVVPLITCHNQAWNPSRYGCSTGQGKNQTYDMHQPHKQARLFTPQPLIGLLPAPSNTRAIQLHRFVWDGERKDENNGICTSSMRSAHPKPMAPRRTNSSEVHIGNFLLVRADYCF